MDGAEGQLEWLLAGGQQLYSFFEMVLNLGLAESGVVDPDFTEEADSAKVLVLIVVSGQFEECLGRVVNIAFLRG